MHRLFGLALAVTLASAFSFQAQPKGSAKHFTNRFGMKFIWIPPGNFVMGSPKDEKERTWHDNELLRDDETQHKVTLTKGFYMGVYPVTQEQWMEIIGNNPSKHKGGKNHPVNQVSWDDCQDFIKKLREKDNKPYRLPTEAEWEYCCRAGTKTPFSFGETISTDQANYDGTFSYGDGKKGVYRQKMMPVGSFPANAWGLHDMHGNMFQWCQDWYRDYPKNDVVDPQGPTKGKERVIRGGSFMSRPTVCRSAFRQPVSPNLSSGLVGIRLCFTPE